MLFSQFGNLDSENFLVQELFQCKLTRKGTIAPSDRQSRLRKSMTNTFEMNRSHTSPSSEFPTKVKLASSASTTSSSIASTSPHAEHAPFVLVRTTSDEAAESKVRFAGQTIPTVATPPPSVSTRHISSVQRNGKNWVGAINFVHKNGTKLFSLFFLSLSSFVSYSIIIYQSL